MKNVRDDVIIEFSDMPTSSEHSIWKLYEWMAMVVPLFLMISHWGIFYVFSLNNQELMNYSGANEICIAWMFFVLFFLFPLGLLPATFLYRRCRIFRIPFVYFLFIIVERWYYGSWFCTNEMIDAHYILIYCIIGIYLVELIGLGLRHRKEIGKLPRLIFLFIVEKVRKMLYHRDNQGKYNKVISMMEERKHES